MQKKFDKFIQKKKILIVCIPESDGIYFSMLSGDWHLRVASIKQMAATFAAFDHPNYVKLISKHLDDILCLPQYVVTMLQ